PLRHVDIDRRRKAHRRAGCAGPALASQAANASEGRAAPTAVVLVGLEVDAGAPAKRVARVAGDAATTVPTGGLRVGDSGRARVSARPAVVHVVCDARAP